jgi:hypothetical protein
MDPLFSEFQKTVCGPHLPILWSNRLLLALQFTRDHPNHIPDVRVVSCGENSLLINPEALARCCGLKRNSLNRNLNQHGFKLDTDCDIAMELRKHCPWVCTSPKCWRKRVFSKGSFNPTSTQEEAAAAAAHARAVRRGERFQQHKRQEEEEWQLDDDQAFADAIDFGLGSFMDEWE